MIYKWKNIFKIIINSKKIDNQYTLSIIDH